MNNIIKENSKYVPSGRVILGNVLGSRHYGLDDETSDIDAWYLMMPTKNDLVRGRIPQRLICTDECDISIFDIRSLLLFIADGDVNKLGLLFNDRDMYISPRYQNLVDQLISRREEIIDKVSPAIHKWARNMFEYKMGHIHYYKKNEEYLKQYGYNTKNVAQAIYYIRIVVNYFMNRNYSVENPMLKAYDCSSFRDEILFIKHGNYSEDEATAIAEQEYEKLIGLTNLGRSSNYGEIKQIIYNEISKVFMEDESIALEKAEAMGQIRKTHFTC